MKECKNEMCKATPACMLEQYGINRRKGTMADKAELASSFEQLGDNCPIVGDLAKKYAKPLASSKKALQILRTKPQ